MSEAISNFTVQFSWSDWISILLNGFFSILLFIIIVGIVTAIYSFLFEDTVPFKSDEALDNLSSGIVDDEVKRAALDTVSNEWLEHAEKDYAAEDLSFEDYAELVKAAYDRNKFTFNTRIVRERDLAKPRVPRKYTVAVSLILVPAAIIAYSFVLNAIHSTSDTVSPVELSALEETGFQIPSLTALQNSVQSITSVPVSELPDTAANIQKQITNVQSQLVQISEENKIRIADAAKVRREAEQIQKQNELLQRVNQEELDAIAAILTQASNRQNFTFLIINIAVAIILAVIAFPRNSILTGIFRKQLGSSVLSTPDEREATRKYRSEMQNEKELVRRERNEKFLSEEDEMHDEMKQVAKKFR